MPARWPPAGPRVGDRTAADAAARLISVVIPVRNGGDLIAQQLAALAAQTYDRDWEVIVADNGSDDDTREVVSGWAARLPALRIVDASDAPGAAHARNAGAAAAAGDLLAFCDADDEVGPTWLAGLAAAIQGGADLAGGPLDPDPLNDPRQQAWRPAQAADQLPVSAGFLPYAHCANLAVRRDVFVALGGFRADFALGDDVELSWRAQLTGYELTFAPSAVVHYRYRGGLRSLLRQFAAYGTIGPHLYAHYRDAGMPPSPAGPAARQWARLLLQLPIAAVSPGRRGDHLRRMALRWGRVRGSLRHRVAYL